MMQTSTARRTEDIHPIIAVVLLAAILGFLLYSESPRTFSNWQSYLDRFWTMHENFILAVIGSFTFNAIAIGSLATQLLGISRQGSRLAALSRSRGSEAQPRSSFSIKGWIFGIGSAVIVMVGLRLLKIPGPASLTPMPIPKLVQEAILICFQGSFALNSLWIVLLLSRIQGKDSFLPFVPKTLPSFPKIKNGIVIGSIGDMESKRKPSWITLPLRALNGNVFVTGSIGTGKTQGTILTFMDQILENFQPSPSILAIDPKGTFIPEVLKMIEKRGLKDRVLHLKLGGNVTFNPIYHPHALKNAEYLNIAQMIRAAALNFTGKSSDSPFWDLSAFNLMKNSLALCAAKNPSHYTLNTLYSEMVRAAGDALGIAEELKGLAADSRFNEEEQFNIKSAAQYFREFDQMDEKLRTGILTTATVFLNQFQEYQASQIFCPEKPTLVSMDEVVDQGKILLFDIASPALARSMGTFIKLHYEQSVLNRLVNKQRGKQLPAVLIADEYQDVVSTGGGVALGDDRFCAKSREANAVAIFATQSITSIKNSVGKEDSAKELIQNFRTMIAGHSTDLLTIHQFQELMGQEEKTRISTSISENAQRPSRNLIAGGFDAKDANISESISTSHQKEYSVTGKEFSTLSSFECFARVYDGNKTLFHKIYLKPYFLQKKNTLHSKILDLLKASCFIIGLFYGAVTHAFPSVCTVVKTPEFLSCLDFKVSGCMCGWPPRPCAQFTYFVPETFIETFPDAKSSYFGGLPGAAIQLGTTPSKTYGAEADNDTQSFQAHALTVPFNMIPFETMPCGAKQVERTCFNTMSEHLGKQWEDGSGDLLQPKFLAWSLSPKACLIKGAAASFSGENGTLLELPPAPVCSTALTSIIPRYPPSDHEACTGWGVFYPRSGVYNGTSSVAGALMVAARLKSLGTEVFSSIPGTFNEKWQMITPQASSCFKEGQNVSQLETAIGAREEKRIPSHELKGFLFTVWNQVSCCRDLAEIPTAVAAIAAMSLVCQGLGTL